MSSDADAALESARARHITGAAIRLARRRNGHHGRRLPQHDAAGQQAWALKLHYAGKTPGQIALELGVAQSTVSRWIKKKD